MAWRQPLAFTPIIIAVAMFLISTCLLVYMVTMWRSTLDFIIYPLEYNSQGIRTQLAYVIVPALLMLCCLFAFHPRIKRKIVWRAALILLIANILACGATFFGSEVVHQKMDDVSYHLSRYVVTFSYATSGSTRRPSVQFHECDVWLILCRDLYTYGGWQVASREMSDFPWQVRLVLNQATGTLEMEVNGRIVYTHRLK